MKNIKNFKEAQELVKEIPIIRKELSDLGYNMSLKANLLADFTECYARDRFGLRLENGKGYDGIDREGKKYQVKYTIIEGTTKGGKEKFTHTLDHIRPNTFDFLIAVILDKNYEIKKELIDSTNKDMRLLGDNEYIFPQDDRNNAINTLLIKNVLLPKLELTYTEFEAKFKKK